MKDNIQFETAKLLKNHLDSENYFKYFSGSDPSWYIFHEDVTAFDRHKGEDFLIHPKNTPVFRYGLPCNDEIQFTIPYDSWDAPSQYSVQTWLRNEHCIHIVIEPYFLSDFQVEGVKYSYNITRQLAMYLNNHKFETGFDTYEEALERALYMSLETINDN